MNDLYSITEMVIDECGGDEWLMVWMGMVNMGMVNMGMVNMVSMMLDGKCGADWRIRLASMALSMVDGDGKCMRLPHAD